MNVINIQPDKKFSDSDRLEHLYAVAALLIEHGGVDPLKNGLSVAQVIGDDIELSFASIMNAAREVIDKPTPDLSKLRRYDLADENFALLPGIAAVDDGKYVLLDDVQHLLKET